MSTSETKAPTRIDRPRSLASGPLAMRLFLLDFQRQLRSKKALMILLIQLLPVVVGGIFLFSQSLDGLTLFRNTVDNVYLPFLLPLAALFFGGPTIVNEIEGRTITYLTLRPISRAPIYLAKLASSITTALVITILPVLIFFALCQFGSSDELSFGLTYLGPALLSVALGTIAYTSLFAALGVLTGATLLLGVIYFVIMEMILATVPVVELVSVKFHLRTIVGTQGADRAGFLSQLILDEPLAFEWWVGVLVTGAFALAAIIAGTLIFKEKQHHV